MDSTRHGFTLIEMSIVVTVIALIAGGIIVGESVIRSSRLQSITTDVQLYKQAVLNFQQKYNALPGDMTNATNYWGAAGGSSADNYTASCYASQGSGTQTCNGNGNNQIGNFGNTAERDEMFRAWQHLSNSGLITPGTYSGVTDSTYHHIIGTNCPASKIKGAGYGLFYVPLSALPSPWFSNIAQGHALFFGGDCSPYEPCGAVLTPAEAASIDQKTDDGLPGTGNVMTQNTNYVARSGASCSTSTNPATAAYNVSNTSVDCPLQFKMGF